MNITHEPVPHSETVQGFAPRNPIAKEATAVKPWSFTKPANIKAKALKLADLVYYQKGSVVSREVINKKTGTVTVFAFDKEEGLSEHTAPFDALVYILDGEAKVIISGKPFKVKKDEIIIMPAHKPHALKAVKRFKMLLIMIRS